jgi:uncharacterized protein YecT (DUF1311 family)
VAWRCDDREAKLRASWWGMLVAAALFASAAPQSAGADDLTNYDAHAVPRCVAAAGAEHAALEACKGVAARPCAAADDATTTLVLCWDREARSWRELLENAYRRAIAAEPERRAALEHANAAWDAWLDAECTYRSAPEFGGSGVQVELVQCAAGLTADRVIEFTEAAN